MPRHIDAEMALKIIDSYAKTVSADGKVFVDAIRDIVGIITPTVDFLPQSEWISVEERLPEIMETVLIAYKEKWEWETEWNFGVDAGSWAIVEGGWNTYHDLCEGQELHITHWMPLPEFPKKKGE